MTTPLLLVLLGLAALTLGGELLVRGASRLAAVAGISPLVVGLTVVAFGTSAPELAVSLQASFAGQTDLAVGNIVGSNIMNVLFILGISALIAPLVVSSRLIWLDVPLMIAASVLMLLFGLDGQISRSEGGILFTGLLVYIGWSIYKSRQEVEAVTQEFAAEYSDESAGTSKATLKNILLQLAFLVVGLIVLTLGAGWLVSGASDLARLFGMSELMIGLTIVAVGTSLPEVAASISATLRGHRDIAVGNVVGSNLFNIMCVLGLSATVAPGGVEVTQTALQLDIPVMIVVAVACLPIFFTGHLIARWEGGLFLAYYIAYTVYLVLGETQAPNIRTFEIAMLGFVLPLTVLTIGVSIIRSVRGA